MALYFEVNRYQKLSVRGKKTLQKHYKSNFICYFGNKRMSYVTERYNLTILIDFSANKTKIRLKKFLVCVTAEANFFSPLGRRQTFFYIDFN